MKSKHKSKAKSVECLLSQPLDTPYYNVNLITDMTLATSEMKSLLQYPPGRYLPEDTTADSRENIEKKRTQSPRTHLLSTFGEILGLLHHQYLKTVLPAIALHTVDLYCSLIYYSLRRHFM